jgi:hypothetical protein
MRTKEQIMGAVQQVLYNVPGEQLKIEMLCDIRDVLVKMNELEEKHQEFAEEGRKLDEKQQEMFQRYSGMMESMKNMSAEDLDLRRALYVQSVPPEFAEDFSGDDETDGQGEEEETEGPAGD